MKPHKKYLPEKYRELTNEEWYSDPAVKEITKNCFIETTDGIFRVYNVYRKHPNGEIVATNMFTGFCFFCFAQPTRHFVKN